MICAANIQKPWMNFFKISLLLRKTISYFLIFISLRILDLLFPMKVKAVVLLGF